MKTGKSLVELATEIERQKTTKKDFVAKSSVMTMTVEQPAADAPKDKVGVAKPETKLVLGDKGTFGINDLAHDQIAGHLNIPRVYYDRMRAEHPHLLVNNVNAWMGRAAAPRLVRTLDGRARAYLSNSYRPLDNADFAEAILPVLLGRKLEIMSCEITEKRLYIKAVDTALFRDVPIGYKMGDGSHKIFETCAPAIICSNSEVGFGRLVIETGVYTKACTNMCLWSDGGMKRTHLGARHKLLGDVENIDHLLSDRTRQKTDEALWLQARDVINGAFDQKLLTVRCDKLAATAENKITGKVEKVIELAAKRFELNDGERESVLKHIIEGGSLTQYGLHAAITRTAQDALDYDRATDLEYTGSKVIELPRHEWQELAMAA